MKHYSDDACFECEVTSLDAISTEIRVTAPKFTAIRSALHLSDMLDGFAEISKAMKLDVLDIMQKFIDREKQKLEEL